MFQPAAGCYSTGRKRKPRNVDENKLRVVFPTVGNNRKVVSGNYLTRRLGEESDCQPSGRLNNYAAHLVSKGALCVKGRVLRQEEVHASLLCNRLEVSTDATGFSIRLLNHTQQSDEGASARKVMGQPGVNPDVKG